jgi:hypothetical protein
MNKILEQIIFKSLFEDIEKTTIKQAPRSVVDKARSLKGYAFRIQSSRTGGTVDIATLIKAVQVNNQYGENSRTSDEKWVYIFGPDLRDVERKLFCNVLILPIDAATKLYDLDNISPALLDRIGEAPVYREKAMIKLTRGQKIDQRANKIVTGVNTILSNSEPVKDITSPGLERGNVIFFDGEEGVDWKKEDGVMYRANYKDDGTKYWEKIEAGLNYAPVNYAGRNKSDAKNFNQPIDNDKGKDAKVIGDENTIVMPKGGFKYGIKNDKEFAKLQQYLIDLSKTPAAAAEFKAYINDPSTGYNDIMKTELIKQFDKFIANGADGNYGDTAKYTIHCWYRYMADKSVYLKNWLTVITVDIANTLLSGLASNPEQNKIKVIAESRLSYKPKYMTIIQSKILQEQLKTSLFEDTIKTVIKQAPRSVVDKATALKGYAFRIQSSRSGGTVDIATLINRVRISDQYGKNSHTNNEKWVYIFGPDLRDAERKFFCNVLILPIAAATKLYDLDNIAPELLDTIGEAPVYREKAMIKLTRGQKIDQRANKRANNIVTDVNSILSNSEPVKDVTTPGLVLNRNPFYQGTEGVDWKEEDGVGYRWNWTDDGIGYWEIQDPGKKYKPINYIGMDKSNDKTHYLVEPYEDDKGKDAKIPEKSAEVETTIVMPKAGFKYGIKNDKEFAKLQQFLIGSFDNPPTVKAKFYEWIESTYEGAPKGTSDLANVIKELDKFISNGADGNFDEPAKYMFSWVCTWTGKNIVDYLNVITVDIVKHLLKDQSNFKVITSDDVTNDAAKVIGAGDEVIGDENTIIMPKDGFKYGIKNNKEFAKLQQYLIKQFNSYDRWYGEYYNYVAYKLRLSYAERDNEDKIMIPFNKFIANGANGNYDDTVKEIVDWLYWYSFSGDWPSADQYTRLSDEEAAKFRMFKPVRFDGKIFSVTLADAFIADDQTTKVITESRLSYKPKYMTIIQSKILQEQLKTSYGKKSFS